MAYLNTNTFLNRNCYKITRFMAQGGFGITYLAEEVGYFKRSGFEDDHYVKHPYPEKVVVKELYYSDYCQRNEVTGLVSISNSEKKVEFEKLVNKQLEEGKILRRLDHPNIVRTRDIFKENGTAYMVMDFEESTDLEEQIKKLGKLEKSKALHYINQVLEAVQYVHERKVLHLDITPSNILIRKDTDEAVLIDFGASLTYDTENKAKSNTSKLITGMKRHFAPVEQADIDNLKQFDATFDTYAIGATLYYILTGKLPPLSSLVSTGKEKIIPPSASITQGGMNEYLDALILKAMAPKFHDRFNTASDFHQMLKRENAYVEKVESIKNIIANEKYKEALTEIIKTKDEFLETDNLKKLKIYCENELEKKLNEDQYQKFIARGQEWYKRQEYQLAMNEYEKAAMLLPDKTEPTEKISLCKQQLEFQIAEQKKKEKINDLLFEARQLIADRRYNDTREAIRAVLLISPDNKDAIQLNQQLDAIMQNEINKLKNDAKKLYEEENYSEALKLYRKLQPKDIMDGKTEKILSELRDADKLNQLYEKVNNLVIELNNINPLANDASVKIAGLKKKHGEIEIQRQQLKLSSQILKKLLEQLNASLNDRQKKADEEKEKQTKLILAEKEKQIQIAEQKTKIISSEKIKQAEIEKGSETVLIKQQEKNDESERTELISQHIDAPPTDYRNPTPTVIISNPNKQPEEKMSFKKRAVLFLIGAVFSIVVGLIVIKIVRGNSTSGVSPDMRSADSASTVMEPPKETRALTTKDISDIQDANALSDESKSAIKNSTDIKNLCEKIANAPETQKKVYDVEHFINKFCDNN